jgi:hypothetical protein
MTELATLSPLARLFARASSTLWSKAQSTKKGLEESKPLNENILKGE